MKTSSAIIVAAVVAVAGGNLHADVLWDNGAPDGSNGYSNVTSGIFGFRRALLDDFIVPEGESWQIREFRWLHAWSTGTPGAGTGLQMKLWRDELAEPGDFLTDVEADQYTEIASGSQWFGRDGSESWITFDSPYTLGPGHYWFEGAIEGPEDDFWLVKANVVERECWIDYSDEYRGPGRLNFGTSADLNFVLSGDVVEAWPQPPEVFADDPAESSRFGSAIAARNNFAVIGAPNDGGIGSAYLFKISARVQVEKWEPSKVGPGAHFGAAVGIDDDFAVVGSPGDDEAGPDAGAIYVFDVTSGGFLHKRLASDAGAGHQFGFSVAAGDGFVVAGAPTSDEGAVESGAVYVFDAGSGEEIHRLLPPTPSSRLHFGFAVSVDAGIVLVGARPAVTAPGAAFLYDAASGAFLHELESDGFDPGDGFGTAVALRDGRAIVGADGDLDRGAAYIFDVATGATLAKIRPKALAGGGFGRSVAIDSGRALIGNIASAHLFDMETGEELQPFIPDDPSVSHQFARTVAIDRHVAIAGAPADDDAGTGAGSTYMFSGCLADLDGDGEVGVRDLLGIIKSWGGKGTAGDIDGDGTVGFGDLLILLAEWGAC